MWWWWGCWWQRRSAVRGHGVGPAETVVIGARGCGGGGGGGVGGRNNDEASGRTFGIVLQDKHRKSMGSSTSSILSAWGCLAQFICSKEAGDAILFILRLKQSGYVPT